MWNNSNPAELYAGTTWELISQDKYIKAGNTSLQTGGSNSISIQKNNLPNIKLSIDNFQLGKGTQEITGEFRGSNSEDKLGYSNGAFYSINFTTRGRGYGDPWMNNNELIGFKASKTWTGMSTSASPKTEYLGNGTDINIQPAYITLKFWKRLT